jgi:hypothetical protein
VKQIDRCVEVHAEMLVSEGAENGEQRIEGGKGKHEGRGELWTDEARIGPGNSPKEMYGRMQRIEPLSWRKTLRLGVEP